MFSDGAPRVLRVVVTLAATFLGGSFAVGFLTSTVSERIDIFKKKKYGRSCGTCRAIGYYTCKLCKGNGTIKWSPLYDPVFINPCVCPTCDGFKVQKCLNCLGYGSV
ncbi:hypothetical protein BUALT_Bualt16G0074400 [Buddleja alternifolia]|uniref:Uncharacterized protein n=1 Tax=Buddleja alternifolia TaxID=168488 RepID=A0AAV6WF78_9LAMI|nr:hypothetical protein BUALT_Bualt16G0074400 [Buddleja alternifolia]